MKQCPEIYLTLRDVLLTKISFFANSLMQYQSQRELLRLHLGKGLNTKHKIQNKIKKT